MQEQKKAGFEKFIDAFCERYKIELEYIELVPRVEMIQTYLEFKRSGKTVDQWFEEQERPLDQKERSLFYWGILLHLGHFVGYSSFP